MRARRRWCGSACRSKRITRIPHAALAGYADVEPVPPALPDGVPVALFAGLIRPYKGLADLLDAWPAVRQRVPGAILHVLGRSLGGDDDAARAAASEGVVADLRYAEPGEWAGAMLRADVVVLPYRSIDQSGVLATAIALGRPVIATDVGGFGETLADTDAGLLVPPRDPAVLAATISALLLDDGLRADLAANAAAAAAGELSWDRSAERHEVGVRPGRRVSSPPRGARGVRRGLPRARRPGARDAGADRDVRRVRLLRDGAAAGRRGAGHAPPLLPRATRSR